jgi:hypothetical protein
MRDDVSRRVGINGVVVTGLVEAGRQLEIEVEPAHLGASRAAFAYPLVRPSSPLHGLGGERRSDRSAQWRGDTKC